MSNKKDIASAKKTIKTAKKGSAARIEANLKNVNIEKLQEKSHLKKLILIKM
jgi:hypothetical protein